MVSTTDQLAISEASRTGAIYLSVFVFSLITGCASPGTPRPPSLNLPQVVSSLQANRVGDVVLLRWTTSSTTTDGSEIRGAMTAEICRGAFGTPATSDRCDPILRLPVKPGASAVEDPLPASLVKGDPVAIAYRVRLSNRNGRSGGISPIYLIASGPAPAVIAGLRAEPTEKGVLLQWQPDRSRLMVEIERRRVPDSKEATKSDGLSDAAAAVRMRVDAGAEPMNGSVDRTAKYGEHYIYTAQRVQRAALAGSVVETRSVLSPEIAVTMHDVFPPKSPHGLVAISNGPGVDLSWQPNTEHDLAGYFVFRQEADTTMEMTQLHTKMLLEPSFHDVSVKAGHTYRYAVLAVDDANNRSALSEAVAETIRNP